MCHALLSPGKFDILDDSESVLLNDSIDSDDINEHNKRKQDNENTLIHPHQPIKGDTLYGIESEDDKDTIKGNTLYDIESEDNEDTIKGDTLYGIESEDDEDTIKGDTLYIIESEDDEDTIKGNTLYNIESEDNEDTIKGNTLYDIESEDNEDIEDNMKPAAIQFAGDTVVDAIDIQDSYILHANDLDDIKEKPIVDMYIPFVNLDEFKAYFENKYEVMRSLLCQFTVATTIDRVMQIPKYHLGNEFPDEAIRNAFYSTFDYKSFQLHDTHVVPNKDTVHEIASLLAPYIRSEKPKLEVLLHNIVEAQAKLNVAEKAVKMQNEAKLDPMGKVLRCVYHYIRTKTSKYLSADGADTNAELRKGSLDNICKVNEKKDMDKSTSLYIHALTLIHDYSISDVADLRGKPGRCVLGCRVCA
jgi:hypothetical protein